MEASDVRLKAKGNHYAINIHHLPAKQCSPLQSNFLKKFFCVRWFVVVVLFLIGVCVCVYVCVCVCVCVWSVRACGHACVRAGVSFHPLIHGYCLCASQFAIINQTSTGAVPSSNRPALELCHRQTDHHWSCAIVKQTSTGAAPSSNRPALELCHHQTDQYWSCAIIKQTSTGTVSNQGQHWEKF